MAHIVFPPDHPSKKITTLMLFAGPMRVLLSQADHRCQIVKSRPLGFALDIRSHIPASSGYWHPPQRSTAIELPVTCSHQSASYLHLPSRSTYTCPSSLSLASSVGLLTLAVTVFLQLSLQSTYMWSNNLIAFLAAVYVHLPQQSIVRFC